MAARKEGYWHSFGTELPDWYDNAACLGLDHDMFFPDTYGNGREAKVICGGCPVIDECYEFAISTRQEFGIWGGTGAASRVKGRREKDARPTICSVDECKRMATGRGWCQLHYGRWKRQGDPHTVLKVGRPRK